jgi:prevent-host-death family protein
MSKNQWQLQEAKNRFSEVVDLAIKQGAQTVTKHGKPSVVILSVEDYEKSVRPRKSLLSALRECPADLTELITDRIQDKARKVEF